MKSETVAEVAKRIAQRRPCSLAASKAWMAERPRNHPARERQTIRDCVVYDLRDCTAHLQQHNDWVASRQELLVTIADLEVIRDQVEDALRRARVNAHYAPDAEG